MRKMLNTLYITSEEAYASLNGENIEVKIGMDEKKAFPLHNLESIVSFSYKGASPALMGKCESSGITLTFFSPHGKYLATVGAGTNGNILLRREQYRVSEDQESSIKIARNMITGKLYNSAEQLLRFTRDHPMQVDCEKLQKTASRIKQLMNKSRIVTNKENLRAIEGNAASEYFSSFNELILQRKDDFIFDGRSRRPPLDRVNALLSFAYSLLANDCTAALYSVGLDPFAGMFHVDRPGRRSLALDIMEEFRVPMADRFVLSLINNRKFERSDFEVQESGAVLLKDDARRDFLAQWQMKKREVITHPFLKETDAEILPEDFLLLDSGGHYTDGTTDITRTIAVGPLTQEMIDDYTYVLKAHLAMHNAVLTPGMNGIDLDAITRAPMRAVGLDFKHGLSHGVGHLLSVHEGPNILRRVPTPITICPGMIMSNEPGVYIDNQFGVRIENEVLMKDDGNGNTINEPITFVPYEREAINPALLTDEELAWVNNYHKMVREVLLPRVDGDLAEFVKAQTEEITK